MPPRVYEKKFILIIIYISSFTFQHEHYFQSTYGVGYNKSPPYEVPKELIHLKGTEISTGIEDGYSQKQFYSYPFLNLNCPSISDLQILHNTPLSANFKCNVSLKQHNGHIGNVSNYTKD